MLELNEIVSKTNLIKNPNPKAHFDNVKLLLITLNYSLASTFAKEINA